MGIFEILSSKNVLNKLESHIPDLYKDGCPSHCLNGA